ncbi:AAA family ATPase [Caenimonas koreensis]|uniref:AAA family ATPase n=1 Tax=Caenimonas koreensis TaxID=367474 RepID=UPI0037845E0F
MIRLHVENFSCIESADFELGAINILIGPQASGKSVLSKLLFFFIDIFTSQYTSVTDDKSFDAFTEEVRSRFAEWFPVSAWGSKKFKIEFVAGDYKVRITRVTYVDALNDTLRLWTSPLVKAHYQETLSLSRAVKARTERKSAASYRSFEATWRIRTEAQKRLRSAMSEDFIDNQTFVPAGRSFFTSLGRAFVAFDQGRILDPLTIRFGRMYSSMQDEIRFMLDRKAPSGFEIELAEILGGEIEWERDKSFVVCPDGRRIPFSALSSGQQELLPLVVAIGLVTALSSGSRNDPESHLLYIEEPEAHLFPSAQSILVAGLAGFTKESVPARRLLLTTHSPYVLAKLNNLIKAGMLENSLPMSKQAALSRIVPKRSRIGLGSMRAYAIIEGRLTSIVDETGLIAADYLDDISGEIGTEFSKLLDLEFQE